MTSQVDAQIRAAIVYDADGEPVGHITFPTPMTISDFIAYRDKWLVAYPNDVSDVVPEGVGA